MAGSLENNETARTQAVVDDFNQKDAGWIQASEIAKAESGLSDNKVESPQLHFEKLSENNITEAKTFADQVFALEKGLAGKDLELQVHTADASAEHSGEINKNYWIARNESGRNGRHNWFLRIRGGYARTLLAWLVCSKA
jgi:hypothetical protein